MGEAKRRQAALGDKYGQEKTILPWVQITKTQADQFMKITTRVSWIGIFLMIAVWLTIRVVGPAFGWWTLN
ncbi:MAG: DUF2839 domain-containing protein [Cyanophyceae cyanobacterium]